MERKDTAGQSKIAVVGIGNVGAGFAFALSLKRLVGELVLVDANSAKAEGEAMDIMHGLPDVCLSLPCVVGAGGVELVLESMLSEEQHQALANSAMVLRENARALGVI